MSTYTKLTSKTNKAKCGAFNKHCTNGGCGGKLITGNNWTEHLKCKHSQLLKSEVKFIECAVDLCSLC